MPFIRGMAEQFRCTARYGLGPVVSTHTPFGLVDAKGRELGAHTRIHPLTVELGPIGDCHGFLALAPGLYFEVLVHVTRDGKPFGASPRRHLFETLEAAQVKGAELVEGARKRYAKRAAAGAKL